MEHAESSTLGWQVRLQRRGIRHAKYFADRQHGGKCSALEKARLWRDKLLRKFGQDERARAFVASARNSSGVVGVSKVAVVASNKLTYYFWQATWSPAPGQRRSFRFSIKKHGDEEAFRLAVKKRNDAIE